MRNQFRAFLITGLLPIASAAIAQGVAQPAYLKAAMSGFHGTQDTLVNAIRSIERGDRGEVAEIRFSETNGMPGYHAVVAKGKRIEFIHIQQDSANVVEIDADSGRVCMLKWQGKSRVHFVDSATVGYSYRAHRKYGLRPEKEAFDILNERYARGEITREELGLMKAEIAKA